MEHRPFGATGLEVSAIGFGCREIGGGYGTSRRPSSPGRSAGRSTSASTASTPPRATAWERRSRRSGGRSGAGRDEAIVVTKFGMGYRTSPTSATAAAQRVARVDRQEPAEPRHRPRRRVHRALARPRDAVRGDDERARRRRARGQGALRRRLELHAATRSRRAWRSGGSTSRSTAGTCSTAAWSSEILPVLRGAGHRIHGLRLARLRPADRARSPRTIDFGARRLAGSTADKMGRDASCSARSSAPSRSRATSRAVDELKAHRGEVRPEPAAARAALDDVASRREHRRSSAAAPSPRSRTTSARSAGRSSDADLAEIDAIFARHGVEHVPGLLDRGDVIDGPGARGQGRDRHRRREWDRPRAWSSCSSRRARRSSSPTSTPSGGEALAAELGDAAAFQRTDVADADEVQALVDFAVGHFGGLARHVQQRRHRRLVRAASSTTTSPTSTG